MRVLRILAENGNTGSSLFSLFLFLFLSLFLSLSLSVCVCVCVSAFSFFILPSSLILLTYFPSEMFNLWFFSSFHSLPSLPLSSSLLLSLMPVVLNIHQPSSTLFAMFDKLILLADGYLIYEGPVSEVGAYFASLGFVCPPGWAIADFLLELVSRCGEEGKHTKHVNHSIPRKEPVELDEEKDNEDPMSEDMSSDIGEDSRDIFSHIELLSTTELASRFSASQQKSVEEGRHPDLSSSSSAHGGRDYSAPAKFKNLWIVQVFVLMQR
jgi:hypothetical protein